MHMKEKKELQQKKRWMNEAVFEKLWGCYSISRNPKILERIVSGMLPLVESIVQHCTSPLYTDLERDDIYSYGVVGLMEAIKNYDAEKNPNFTGYAYIRIQGSIYDGIVRFRGLRRNHLRKRRRLQLQVEEAQQELARDPSHREIQMRIGLEEQEYLQILSEEQSLHILSLESLENGDFALKDERTPESYMENIITKDVMQNVLRESVKKLAPIEQKIIRMHYYEGLTFREIGRRMGCSKTWISRNHKTAMQRLKNMKIRERIEK